MMRTRPREHWRQLPGGRVVKVNVGVPKKKVYSVRTVPKKLLEEYEYVGMNHYAGKDFGMSCPPKKKEVWVARGLPKKVRDTTIKHEVIEAEEMKEGKDYWPAHKIAMKKESW
jgi:hypothetical protein